MKKALALVLALALALSLVACGGAPASTADSGDGSAAASGTAAGGLYPGTPDAEGITVSQLLRMCVKRFVREYYESVDFMEVILGD